MSFSFFGKLVGGGAIPAFVGLVRLAGGSRSISINGCEASGKSKSAEVSLTRSRHEDFLACSCLARPRKRSYSASALLLWLWLKAMDRG